MKEILKQQVVDVTSLFIIQDYYSGVKHQYEKLLLGLNGNCLTFCGMSTEEKLRLLVK